MESGLAALLVATVPRRPRDRRVAVLARPSPAGSLAGVVIVLVGSARWGVGSVLSQPLALPARPLVGSGMQMLVGGAALLMLSVATGEWTTSALSQASWASIAALGGWLFGEHLTLSTLVGTVILTVSVTLAVRARTRSRR